MYVIDTSLRLDGTYQDVLLTCYSLSSPSSQKRIALECLGVCVLAKVSSKARRHCSCLNGYTKPPNEPSGHKLDKYRNHEHTQFG
jgi:hypothetical protein